MAIFEDHGTLDIEADGQILIIEGTGPWNLESLDKSGSVALPVVQPLLGKPWGVLAILHGQVIYVPDAADALVDIVREDKRKGRVASAIILTGSDSPNFSENHISEIYTRAGEEFAFFDNQEAAKNWLLKKLADYTAD